jgi:hypothetical protein
MELLRRVRKISKVSKDFQNIKMATPSNYINKNREDIMKFLKMAVNDRASNEYAELSSNLIKMFVDSDTKKNGRVDKQGFSYLIDSAAFTPRLFGFAPEDKEMYPTAELKAKGREALFKSIDIDGAGTISLEQWLKFGIEHIARKAATLDSHPNLEKPHKEEYLAFIKKALVPGSEEHLELYWYLLELFTQHCNKAALANKHAFSVMVNKACEIPLRHGVLKGAPTTDYFDKFGDSMTFDEWLEFAIKAIYKVRQLVRQK